MVLGDTILVASLKWTLYLALASVAAAVPMGLMAAKYYKRSRRKVMFVTLMLSTLEAQLAGIDAIRPGERMCDVDAVARNLIKRAGYGRYFGHGLGHGLGLDVHEAPSLSWRSTAKLEPGMVVTVEPGIYLPGVGGVRIEDDVIVTDRGCRVLTSVTKNIDDLVL